jgi:hypothetical protein
MESSSMILPWAVIALLAAQVIALGVTVAVLGRFSRRSEEMLAAMEEEARKTLEQARATMERLEGIALRTDELIRDRVTPALAEIGKTARGVGETVTQLQWIVGGVAAASGPGALALVAQRVLRTGSRGRNGLLALGIGAGLRALVHTLRRRNHDGPVRSDAA